MGGVCESGTLPLQICGLNSYTYLCQPFGRRVFMGNVKRKGGKL